jgi:hypothetical protein
MKTPMRLLFGIRTTGTVSLSITANGPLPSQPPDLRIKTSEQDIGIACSNNTWVASLDAGDHIVYMPASGDCWFEAPLAFTVSAPATLIAPANPSGAPLVSWAGTAGTTSDPKNPWPPPLVGNLDAALLAESTWLCNALMTVDAQISSERSYP